MKKLALLLYFLFANILFANILQDAIDKAPVGATLKLPKGIYKGGIIINKPISIIGQEKGVIIDGLNNGIVIKVRSSYVTLKNLTVINSGSQYEKLDGAISIVKDKMGKLTQCEVSHCTIKNCLFGIDMQMTDNSLISDNNITSKDLPLGLRGDGLRLWYANDNVVKNNSLIKSRDMVVWYSHGNLIENNYGRENRYSLHFMYAGENLVKNNTYERNSVGIFFMYSQDTIAIGNTIKSSQGATGMGIGLKDSSNFTLKDNTVIYCAQGMYIDRSPFEPDAHNIIEGNKILYNAEAIHFHSLSINNIIKNNIIQGNIEDIVNDSKRDRVVDNDIVGNYWDNYEGFDKNKDGIGDGAYNYYAYADKVWLLNPNIKFFYGSPVISILNFLAKLAPFSEPVLLLSDEHPKMYEGEV